MSNKKRHCAFTQVDVFTSVPLQGNQLAVFPDATGLTDEQMQAIARETNLSETTFVFPRDKKIEEKEGIRVRIFTTTEELPFAGHPTLGTAHVLRGNSGAEEVALALNVGRIPVNFSIHEGEIFGVMTQREPHFGHMHSRDAVARAVGLKRGDIADDIPIQTVSTANAFAIVPVKSLKVLRSLEPTWTAMHRYLEQSDAKFFYFVSRETENPGVAMQARMFFYGGEDPATGSAAGPCIAWAVKHGAIGSREQVLLEQGIEMNRRSRIFVSAEREGDKIVNVRVGGHVVEVVRGELFF
ncbi:MAG TPA: PhzF family phenazine biosynthesis protein [Candidatus Limnocylindrales bacterium]|nr:PhzF family phenazine biosynthesis protein [Candidatus Limnocylindrales bacterium]